MEGQHNLLAMCDSCPIEKDANGLCYDSNGIWTQDKKGNWIFEGLWKCIHYHKDDNGCHCESMDNILGEST